MGDGDDGDFRLIAQSEAKPEGAVRGEVADQDVRQRLVIVAVLVLPVQAFIPGFTAPDGSTVLIDGVTALAFAAHVMCFWLRLLVLGSYKAALDPDHAVMVENQENPAARDVIRIIGLTLGFQPLGYSLKLAQSRVHMVRKFIGRLIPFGQLVDFAPRCLKDSLILIRKLNRMRVGPPHSVRVRKIEMDFGPFPALRLPQR